MDEFSLRTHWPLCEENQSASAEVDEERDIGADENGGVTFGPGLHLSGVRECYSLIFFLSSWK